MTETRPPRIDDKTWALPAYDATLYGAKNRRHALVIPVINEGERIRAQLMRIKAAGLPVDVVIADGGSTDGSLAPAFMQSANVRAVLTKAGPGKLGAQLRMAYAWCLREGYESIVTIDGNGKDGVEAVADMVAKLEAGYDYVQGSRYLPGGGAAHTPLERTIANRFVHAPLLSLAGRRWFTDTTNGFRAYSARYLLDPRVQPFRDVFQNYELLFYLTTRAGQIGMKVGHVAVRRDYPQSAKTPTKISGLSAKLRILAQTLDTATGACHPEQATLLKNRGLCGILFLLLTAWMLILYLPNPLFSPDSWAYYELAQTVFKDFYKLTHFRSFWSEVPYSSSFPPLFPTLIALVSEAVGYGARLQYILGFLFFIGFACCAERLIRKNLSMPYAGLGISLLLASTVLRGELWGGRSIPLQLLLYVIMFTLVLRWKSFNFFQLLGLGALCGLAVLNRFDAILLAPLLFSAHVLMFRKPLRALPMLLGALVAIAPWMIYSLGTFGVLFVTDNTWVAKSIDPRAFVTDWWPAPRPDLHDDFGAWLQKIAANTMRFGYQALRPIGNKILLVLILFLAFMLVLTLLLKRARTVAAAPNDTGRRFLRSACLFWLLMLLIMLPQILSGYFDDRYYSALFFSAFLIGFALLSINLASDLQREAVAAVFFLLCALAASVALHRHWDPGADKVARWRNFDNPSVLAPLQDCMGKNPSSRLLVIGDNTLAARLGAQGGISAFLEPNNLARGALDMMSARQFITHWNIAYVLVMDKARLQWAISTFALTKIPGCPLHLYNASR